MVILIGGGHHGYLFTACSICGVGGDHDGRCYLFTFPAYRISVLNGGQRCSVVDWGEMDEPMRSRSAIARTGNGRTKEHLTVARMTICSTSM